MNLVLALLCLVYAALWTESSAQDTVQLLQRWRNIHNNLDLLQEQRVSERVHSSHVQEVNVAFERVGDFWTQFVGNESTQNISLACQNGIQYLLEHQGGLLDLPLIVDMIDAIGKPPAGYFEGNIFASGAYDECFAIGYTDYCSGSVTLVGTPLTWLFGMCVPSGCDTIDVSIAINSSTMLYANSSTMSCDESTKPPYNAGAVIMITVCFIFVSLVSVSTVMDWTVIFLKTKTIYRIFGGGKKASDTDKSENTSVNQSEKKPLLLGTSKKKTSLFTFIRAFSLYKIIPTILATDQPPSAITCLNGLRVISMFWIILCHTHFAVTSLVDNTVVLKNFLSRFTFQPISNGYFGVDSFFFLSGLLVTYLTLRQMARKNGRFPFIAYYLHRYLRLTPAYAFVLFFIWLVSMHLVDGPSYSQLTWVGSYQYQYCSQYWWTNLLYINNFHPWELAKECMGWTWYLANDMQFFIIAPLIIIPLYHIIPIGIAISAVLLLISFIISATLTGIYDFQSNTFAEFAYNHTVDASLPAYNDLLYIKPWYRITPYIVGIFMGYLFHHKVRAPFGQLVNLVVYTVTWILAAVILVSCLYGLYFTWHGHTPTPAENVIYITFSRFAWAVGLALIVFACHNGYGGVINSFLSMKLWVPLSRLTYNAYLVHPMIMAAVLGSERKSLHYEDVNMAVYAVANVVLSFGAAALVSVFVEFPLGNVEQAIFKLVGLGERESTRRGITVKPKQETK